MTKGNAIIRHIRTGIKPFARPVGQTPDRPFGRPSHPPIPSIINLVLLLPLPSPLQSLLSSVPPSRVRLSFPIFSVLMSILYGSSCGSSKISRSLSDEVYTLGMQTRYSLKIHLRITLCILIGIHTPRNDHLTDCRLRQLQQPLRQLPSCPLTHNPPKPIV